MAEIGYGVSSTGSLLDALDAIPTEYRAFFREGFSRLAKFPRAQWSKLISILEDAAPYPNSVELDPMFETLGLEKSGGASLISTARFVLGVIALRDDSPNDFIEAALAAKVLDSSDREAITAFALLVVQTRTELKRSLAAGTLKHSVLPSLTGFDIKTDVRLEFSEGKVSIAAPVLVVHVDTDTSANEIWFQMTYTQLVALQSKLNKSLEELRQAQAISKKLS